MTTDSGKKLCEYFCDQCGDCMDCYGDQDCIDGGFHSCEKMSKPTPCANCERLEDQLYHESRKAPEVEYKLGHEIEVLKKKLELAVEALKFYADFENWETSAIDDLCAVKTKLTKDKESFGECEQAGLASKLVIYGGKRAREALAKLEEKEG